MASPYPVGITTILPGNQSFVVTATPGASTGALRIDHMGGTLSIVTRHAEYGNSSSSWISEVPNKYRVELKIKVAEDATSLESIYTLGNYYDVYIKRSSGATTYDKIASTLFAEEPKEVPEDGNSFRTFELTFLGGTYTAAVAAGTVPTLA